MSGAASYIKSSWQLSDAQIEILIGVLNFSAIGGAALAHVIIDKYGRRKTFMLTCVVFIVGVTCMAVAQDYYMLLAFRVLTGVGMGVGFSVDPVYIAEVSPKQYRGELVTWSEIATNVGILAGFVTSFLFSDVHEGLAWRLMLGCGVFAPLLLLVLTIFVMPESPRWLVANDREQDARQVLSRLTHPDEDRTAIIGDIRQAIRDEAESAVGWHAVLFPESPGLRRAVRVGVGVAIAQQVMAEESLLFYQPQILSDMGIPRHVVFLALIAMGALKTLCIVVSACFLDSKGRRPMLLISVAGMGKSLLAIGLALWFDYQWGVVMAIWGYMSYFSLGIGPVCWLLASEVFPLSIRAKAMALATCANRLTSAIIASTFPSWAKAMPGRPNAGYFFFFTAVAAVCWIIIYLYVPETKGMSLEKMAEVFDKAAKPSTAPELPTNEPAKVSDTPNPILPVASSSISDDADDYDSRSRKSPVAVSLRHNDDDGGDLPPSAAV